MTRPEALALFGLLLAAFPKARLDKTNQEAYTAFISELPYEAAAREAIMALIRTEQWFPTVAQIRDEYRRYHDLHAPRGLPEPETSEEERQRNLRRIRALREGLGRDLSESERLDALRRAEEDV